jgi:TonB family protein
MGCRYSLFMQKLLGSFVVLLLWSVPALGRCQSTDLPAAQSAPVPNAPAPNAPASAGKSLFDMPAPNFDRPTGAALNPKKGWFCDAPPGGIFAEKSGHVTEAMKGQVRNYEVLVHAQVREIWINSLPRDATKNAWAKGRVAKVRYVIRNDGSHSSPEVTLSSGRSDYDAAALDAIRNRDVFPPMPEGYSGPLRICMTFTTNEDMPDHSQDWIKKAKK